MFVNSALSIDSTQQWVAAQLSIFFAFEFLHWEFFLFKLKIITQFAIFSQTNQLKNKKEIELRALFQFAYHWEFEAKTNPNQK